MSESTHPPHGTTSTDDGRSVLRCWRASLCSKVARLVNIRQPLPLSIAALKQCVHGICRYGFFWYFYQDGTIQHEVKLTGILSTNGLSEGEVRYFSKPACT